MGNAGSGSTGSFHGSRYLPNNSSGRSSFDTSSAVKRKRGNSSDSAAGDFGWYEDFEPPSAYNSFTSDFTKQPLQHALSLPAPVSEPPMYVLESSLETQQLWYKTAGRRPQQPAHEREAIEREWSHNFEVSSIKYPNSDSLDSIPPLAVPSFSSTSTPRSESRHEIVHRGQSQFSNSVSKSFSNEAVSSMTLQMPSYRIVRDENGREFAEYLIIISLGGRGAVTFGIWKRHSDFDALAKCITEIDARAPQPHTFKNALLSWQCVQQRKYWYKCLNTEYLELKCFLLERFMHDVLFETHTSKILGEFLGLQ